MAGSCRNLLTPRGGGMATWAEKGSSLGNLGREGEPLCFFLTMRGRGPGPACRWPFTNSCSQQSQDVKEIFSSENIFPDSGEYNWKKIPNNPFF